MWSLLLVALYFLAKKCNEHAFGRMAKSRALRYQRTLCLVVLPAMLVYELVKVGLAAAAGGGDVLLWASLGCSLACTAIELAYSAVYYKKCSLDFPDDDVPLVSVNGDDGAEGDGNGVTSASRVHRLRFTKDNIDAGKAKAGKQKAIKLVRLIKASKPDRLLIASASTCLMIAAVTNTAIPRFTGQIIDSVALEDDRSMYNKTMVYLVVSAIVCSIFTGLRGGQVCVCVCDLIVCIQRVFTHVDFVKGFKHTFTNRKAYPPKMTLTPITHHITLFFFSLSHTTQHSTTHTHNTYTLTCQHHFAVHAGHRPHPTPTPRAAV